MNRSMTIAVMLLAVQAFGKEGQEPPRRLLKGRLEESTGELRRLFRLRCDGSVLRLDRASFAPQVREGLKDAQRVRRKEDLGAQTQPQSMAAAIEAPDLQAMGLLFEELLTSGMSAPYGGGGREAFQEVFDLDALRGTFRVEGRTVCVTVWEEDGPRRVLELFDDGAGAFRLRISGAGDGLTVALDQDRQGRVNLAFFSGKTEFAGSAENFAALRSRNASLMEKEFFPLLKKLGIDLPPPGDDPSGNSRPGR